MAGVTDPTTTQTEPAATREAPGDDERPAAEPGDRPAPQPGDRPPEAKGPTVRRQLEVPPSQRYVQTARGTAAGSEQGGPSLVRGALIGGSVALFLALVLVVLGGLFTFTAGLIVVAVFLGRLTAVGVNAGAGEAGSQASRLAIAVGASLAAIAVAQVGLWLWAGVEGGRLGLFDFLGEVYGALVPLQFLLAGGTAWLSTR